MIPFLASIEIIVWNMDFLALSQECRHPREGRSRNAVLGAHQKIKVIADRAVNPCGVELIEWLFVFCLSFRRALMYNKYALMRNALDKGR